MHMSEPENSKSCESGCPNCSCGALIPEADAPSGWGVVGPALLAFWGPLALAVASAARFPNHASIAALAGLVAGMVLAYVAVHVFWKG